jgi:hypothetical protein
LVSFAFFQNFELYDVFHYDIERDNLEDKPVNDNPCEAKRLVSFALFQNFEFFDLFHY